MAFLTLLYAHLLGEFLPSKSNERIIKISHAGIWTGTILVAVYLLGFSVTFLDASFLFVAHLIVDYMNTKSIGIYRNLNFYKSVLLDQLIYILLILVLMLVKGML